MAAVHGMVMTHQPDIASEPTGNHQSRVTSVSPSLQPNRPAHSASCGAFLQEWFSENEFWLVPYAAFCFLRDLFGTAEHWKWGVMARPTPQVRTVYAALRPTWSNLQPQRSTGRAAQPGL